MLRIILAGFYFGNPVPVSYTALAGQMFSFLVMWPETNRKPAGWPVSVAGGMSHNIGQIAVAAFVVENINIFTICRCRGRHVTGLVLIGVAAQEIMLRIGGRLKR